MATIQPPPTYADPVLVDERSGKSRFNPIWLKWFLDIADILSSAGGGGGTIVHNDTTGLQGGTANEFFHLTNAQHGILTGAVGTVWTPTLTNVTNIAASTAYQGQYIRFASTVVFSGRVDVDPTGAGACELGISVPIASNFGAVEDVGGVGFCSTVAGFGVALQADSANDRISMRWIAVDIANQPVSFAGTYQVI